MSKLTREMIKDLNNVLKDRGVGFRYEFSGENTYAPKAQITVEDNDNGWIDNVIVNCTDAYYEWLIEWFSTKYGVIITFNNTGSIFWSRDYS